MKLKKQVTVCGGAIFCVAVFSLYLMLDRVQHDPARRQSAGNFPRVSRRSLYEFPLSWVTFFAVWVCLNGSIYQSLRWGFFRLASVKASDVTNSFLALS